MKTKKESLEYLELKNMLSQLGAMMNMLIPEKVSVSYIAESTGKSRQAVRQYLINNFKYEEDFWNKGGKTFVAREVAITLLSRAANKKIAA